MTIYSTPNSTPLTTSGFQGTTSGPAVNGLQITNGPVGMFPPNSDMRSGDTVMAAVSRASVPANVKLTNAILGTTPDPSGRSLSEAMSEGGRVGTAAKPTTIRNERGFLAVGSGFDTMNISANGGGGIGAGGASQELGQAAGQASQLATPTPSSVITTAANPNYQG